MALLYRADLRPTKLELLTAWLPTRTWYPGSTAAGLKRVVSFRFDDPAGEVGIETLLVRAGEGPLLQTPLTYRGAPLEGREQWLVGTTDHSVLGRRWVYDACGDPVYADTLARAIFTGASQVDEFVETDGRLEHREPSMLVKGSGAQGAESPTINALVRVDDHDPTLIVAESVELAVLRILDDAGGRPGTDADLPPNLIGTWDGRSAPLLLAHARAT